MCFLASLRGATSNGEDALVNMWKECSDEVKDSLGSIVIPLGSLYIGLCRHRALLFKVRLVTFIFSIFWLLFFQGLNHFVESSWHTLVVLSDLAINA